jgi:hypothetical protein
MKYKIVAVVITSLIIGSIVGSAITTWRYNNLLGTQGFRDFNSFKSSLAYLSKKNGVVRSQDEAVVHAKTLLALNTISLGQNFDTLGEDAQNDAVRLIEHLEKTPSLRLDSDNEIEKWASLIRQCIVNGIDQGAPVVAKCSRNAPGPDNNVALSTASL